MYKQEIKDFKRFGSDVIMLHSDLEPYVVRYNCNMFERNGELPVFKTSSVIGNSRKEICEWYSSEYDKALDWERKYDHVVMGGVPEHAWMPGGGYADVTDRFTGFGFYLEYPNGSKVKYIMINSCIDGMCDLRGKDLECMRYYERAKNCKPRIDFATSYRLKYNKYPTC